MELEQFLSLVVEGYLFEDLRSMITIGRHPGGAGYPILMTTMAGMELLGGLMSTDDFKGWEKSTEYLCRYLQGPLGDIDERYKKQSAVDMFILLVRNGIAHSAMAKSRILVHKQNRGAHFLFLPDGLFAVCAPRLADDFTLSYWNNVRPIAFQGKSRKKITRATMGARLKEMLLQHEAEATPIFTALAADFHPSLPPVSSDDIPISRGCGLEP